MSSTDPAEPERRELILQLLRASKKPLSIAYIAEQVDAHPNTVRFHLDTLIRTGRVEQAPTETAGPGRPPALYRAIRGMDPTGPTNYRVLAQILAGYLTTNSPDPNAAAVELGRTWGQSMAVKEPGPKPTRTGCVRALTEVLEDLGFTPEPVPSGRASQIRLRHCPFHEVVKSHGNVICALHLGLMQGVLSSLGAPVTVDRLDPFAEPDLCVASIAPVDPSADRGAVR